jgi:predicted transcriptional regulator
MTLTKKIAISLPDELHRDIERARKRAKKDRSTWIQEAASEYLDKRTKEDEIEAWLSADERVPPAADELALYRWKERHWAELFVDEPAKQARSKARK